MGIGKILKQQDKHKQELISWKQRQQTRKPG